MDDKKRTAEYWRDIGERFARLHAAAPEMLRVLVQAVDESGYRLSGPTDNRAAEDSEPKWVCNARAVISAAGDPDYFTPR